MDLLAAGRTGEVYIVHDARAQAEQWPLQLRLAAVTGQLTDNLALKIALEAPEEELPARNARMSREQYALERLVHLNIVRTGTVGWHEGRAFFTMELLEGPSLQRLHVPPMKPPKVLVALGAIQAFGS